MESRRWAVASPSGSACPSSTAIRPIEDAAGIHAAEIFERYGEQDFRDGERRLVARLIEGEVRVIATGGGAFVDARTRQLLNERAITVWLDAPVDVLAERTARRDTRPLLKNGDPKGTLERLVGGAPAFIPRKRISM